MPTQKFKNRNIRKLTRLGKASLAVTLPVDLVAELGLAPPIQNYDLYLSFKKPAGW